MPGSMPEGKDFILKFLLDKGIKSVLDVGPGSGNYYDLLSPHIDAHWVAVEIFGPYLERFALNNKYDEIIIADIHDIDWKVLGIFDVIILGDVLEHMEETRGRKVLENSSNHATWVVVSLPIVDYPQGPSYGNSHEAHVEQYTPERMHALLRPFDVVAAKEGEVIGVYIFRKKDA